MTQGSESLKILLLDDADEVRAAIRRFLEEAGNEVRDVGLSGDLLRALKERSYDAVFLDVQLGDESTVGETRELFESLFPETPLPHEELLAELYLSPEQPVSGRYLLPMIEAVAPRTKVIMLTGAWEGEDDEHFVRRHGSYTVQKLAPDESFEGGSPLQSLRTELVQALDEIRLAAGRSAPGGARR